jgi:molybdenum cofactor biosynthesis enzyme MoaA
MTDLNLLVTQAVEAALMDHIERYHGKHSKKFIKPTPIEVTIYAKSIGFKLDGQNFVDFYESKGWVVGKSPMKDWRAAVRTWKRQKDQEVSVVKHETVHRCRHCDRSRPESQMKQCPPPFSYQWECREKCR